MTVRGASVGTATDASAQYSLMVPSAQDTLVFSFVGYETQEVPIRGRAHVEVSLVPTVLQGEELVVTGYQIQRKATLTGAVETVEVEEIQSDPQSNVIKSLQGHVPGVYVYTNRDALFRPSSAGALLPRRSMNTLEWKKNGMST